MLSAKLFQGDRSGEYGFTFEISPICHCVVTAEQFGVADLFDDIVSKPGYVLDDLGWSWIKYTQVIRAIPKVATA